MTKRYIVYISSVSIGTVLLFTSLHKTFANGYYYTDSDYEKSSTYAGITDSNNIRTVSVSESNKNVTQVAKGDDVRKVYNTIIVRTKKKQEEKPQEVQKVQKIEKTEVVEKKTIQTAPETVKPTKTEEQKTKTKTNITDKIREIVKPFRQKTPDDWYLYALAGYTMVFPKYITMTNTDQVGDMVKKMNGFGFIAGLKVYLNNDKLALFVAPEVFYNKLNLGQADFNYKARVLALYDNTTDPSSLVPHVDVAFPVPATTTIKTKDMFGGTLRLGFTIMNAVSLYGKVSVGSIRYGISSTLYVDKMTTGDWDTVLGRVTDTTQKTNLINNTISEWNNPKAKYYLGSKSVSASKHALLYGIGAGIELGMWNQHFIMRIDYDHYFSSGMVSFNSYYVPWDSSSNTKIKIRSSFGILKLSAGIAF